MRTRLIPTLLIAACALFIASCTDQGEPVAPAPCVFDLTDPAGGSELPTASSVLIRWTSAEAGDSVALELHQDSAKLCDIAQRTENDGEYLWTVSSCETGVGEGFSIRVADADDPSCGTTGDDFTIAAEIETCGFAITQPAAGGDFSLGAILEINWSSTAASSTVLLELHRGRAKLCDIAVVALNDGVFDWAVDDCGAGLGEGFMIRVADTEDASCESFSEPFGIITPPTSFANDIQPIFNGSCATEACHSVPFPACGLDLSAGLSYSQLVEIAAQCDPGLRVDPGEPTTSALYNRVTGSGGVSQMPLGGSLGPQDIEKIRVWIAEGALDN